MKCAITNVRETLETVFPNYGDAERREIFKTIVEDVADVLRMTADSLQMEGAGNDSAWRCLLRCEDRLRLALRLDEILEAGEPDTTETGLPVAQNDGGAA